MTRDSGAPRGAPASLLAEMKAVIAAVFEEEVAPEAIRDDVDVVDDSEHLIIGRRLDSLDVVQIVAAIEERYGVNLADSLDAEGDLTLAAIGDRIAAGSSDGRRD